jgi:hypothetical protein
VEEVRNCSQLTLVDPATVDLTNPPRPADHVRTRTLGRVHDLQFSSCVRHAKQSQVKEYIQETCSHDNCSLLVFSRAISSFKSQIPDFNS